MRLIGLSFVVIALAGSAAFSASGCGTAVQEANGPDGGAADAALDGAADAAGQDAAADGSPGGAGVGSPCGSDDQCANSLCLGGAFSGGYCARATTECNPGNPSSCPAGALCVKFQALDVDGGPAPSPGGVDFCLKTCTGPSDCRQGYQCCVSPMAEPAGMVCVPPSMC